MMSEHESRIVTFRVGRDLFAADIVSVERVLRHQQPRSVPGAPPWLEGVIDYQGRVVPVIDLRRRFGVADASIGSQTRLLVLRDGDDWTAVVVDGVLEVRPLGEDGVAPAPPIFRGLDGDIVRGMVRRGEQLVVVLDVPRLLAMRASLALTRTDDGDANAA